MATEFGLIFLDLEFREFLMGLESCLNMTCWVCAKVFAFSFFALNCSELLLSLVLLVPLQKDCHPRSNNSV